MSIIIAIANGKGGVGKSTVSINLAGALAKPSSPVFLVDADPQGTSTEWFEARKNQPNYQSQENLEASSTPWSSGDLTTKLERLDKKFSFILIDCGPANDKTMRTAFALSDFAIIPVTPSPFDIRSVKKTIDMVKDGQASGAVKIKPYLLISRKIVGTTLGREAHEVLVTLDVPILKTEISQRIALCEAGILGQTIQEYAPESQAAIEFKNLSKEVVSWQKQSSRP